MKAPVFLFALLFQVSEALAQVRVPQVTDLKPSSTNTNFPEVRFDSEPKVAEKINTFLQLEHLSIVPGASRKSPFERVTYEPNRCCSYVYFYDWKKQETLQNILSLILSGEANGAYPEGFEAYANFDLRTGNPVLLPNLFKKDGLDQVTQILNERVKETIEHYRAQIRNDSGTEQIDTESVGMMREQIGLYTDCLEGMEENSIDHYRYYFKQDSMVFARGRCSNHALRAIDDLGDFEIGFSYTAIEAYLTPYGVNLIKGGRTGAETGSPEGKMYKGKIGGKYPVTAVITIIYPDQSLSMHYWYDKVKEPIEWSGRFSNNHFSLTEEDYHDENLKTWIPKAHIEADWLDHKIKGTWTNFKTKEVLDLELFEY